MADEFFDDVFRDAEEVKKADVAADDKLRMVASLATQAQELEQRIKELQQLTRQQEDNLRDIVERQLPDVMKEIGLRDFTMENGTSISLENEVYATVPAGTKDQCLDWLRDRGFGDMIKNEFKIQFNVGEDEFATSVRHALLTLDQPVNFTQRATVLPQTLRAFIREQDKKGVDVPEDLFSIHRVSRAKFKKGK